MRFSLTCPAPGEATCEATGELFEQLHEQLNSDLERAADLAIAIRGICAGCPHAPIDWIRAQFGLGREQEAVELLDELIREDVHFDSDLFFFKGFLFAAEDDHQEAVEWFTKAYADDPVSHNANCGLAGSLLALERTGEAKAHAQIAVETDSECEMALAALICSLADLEEKDEAIELVQSSGNALQDPLSS